jgi:drug/metabolite transporter (DMT)-like permease
MPWLLATSLLWAFSFGLIKGRLTGIDPVFVAFARLCLSAVVFLPFLRPMRLRPDETMKLMGVGALQYGLMYVLYLSAYRYLQAHEVALFTVTTPLYVALLARVLERDRSVRGPLAATLAVLGSLAIAASALSDGDLLIGFLLLQGANLAFAAGQMLWRQMAPGDWKTQLTRFGLLYVGAAGVCGLATVLTSQVSSADISGEQWLTLGSCGMSARQRRAPPAWRS